MPTEYEPNARLQAEVEAFVANKKYEEFEPLRKYKAKMLTVLRTRLNTEGEEEQCKGRPVKCIKLSPALEALTEAHYLIVVDHLFWVNSEGAAREAELFNGLVSLAVIPSKSGQINFKVRKPEIQEYRLTVRRFGPYTEDLAAVYQSAADKFVATSKPVVKPAPVAKPVPVVAVVAAAAAAAA